MCVALPITNPDNVPDYNGCGSYNFNINFEHYNMHDFDKCCNVHDVCYEICNESKKNCDNSLGSCLNSACDRWAVEQNWGFFQKLCKFIIKLFFYFFYFIALFQHVKLL